MNNDIINNDIKEEINEIFNDPRANLTENEMPDPRWVWRKNVELSRSDPRNSKFYVNYVGSKGTRKYESNLSNASSSEKKPNHYLKHLVKIGCPQHDLKNIFENNLKLNVEPTICTHKSWKCDNMNNFGKLQCVLNMDEIGLEWKRGAYSLNPLRISYGSSFVTNIFCKRIANTNFNKIFRPGSYGDTPSLKKGSWKDGKVFYVFKNDKLLLKVNHFINIIFELQSPSTIVDNKNNKHFIIDGWQNVVGGVGFYSPSKQQMKNNKSIQTVLVFRKSMDFPKECLQESKIKIYVKKNYYHHNNNNKLIIGQQEVRLTNNNNDNNHNNNYSPSPLTDNCSIIPSIMNNNICFTDTVSTFDIPMEVPQFVNENHNNNNNNNDNINHYNDEMSVISHIGYSGHHYSSQSVIGQRYNPMQCMIPNNNDNMNNTNNGPFYESAENNQFLSEQNEYLSMKVNNLEAENKEFMEQNDQLLEEKNNLLNQVQNLQRSLNQKEFEIKELKRSKVEYGQNEQYGQYRQCVQYGQYEQCEQYGQYQQYDLRQYPQFNYRQ